MIHIFHAKYCRQGMIKGMQGMREKCECLHSLWLPDHLMSGISNQE